MDKEVQKRILVVDDNVDSADSLAMLIQTLGHEVCVAYDGTDALETAQRFSPSIVFLDIGLPGLNGYEVIKEFRKRASFRQVIFVALSGTVKKEIASKPKKLGLTCILLNL